MTPQRCDYLLALVALAIEAMDREDVPADLRERAARILKLAPAEVTHIEHSPEPPA